MSSYITADAFTSTSTSLLYISPPPPPPSPPPPAHPHHPTHSASSSLSSLSCLDSASNSNSGSRRRADKDREVEVIDVDAHADGRGEGQAQEEGERQEERTKYVAYHDWKHFSSIRNLKGPHTGLPAVRETPPYPYPASPTADYSAPPN
ncbi:hypothetical protein B0H13DRAFT_2649270, partial [Mycena leptocephala]